LEIHVLTALACQQSEVLRTRTDRRHRSGLRFARDAHLFENVLRYRVVGKLGAVITLQERLNRARVQECLALGEKVIPFLSRGNDATS